ncbi:MAG: conjugal transfer ATP-binding protein TraC, partial [Patescibacteria group bacterium]|nr:conjugal transfer ATP-binding protein TraC [Patescibacteria group bacterium]
EGGESLVQRLTKYTKGTWAGFINRPSNVDINKKFVVFSMRDMEDELKPVAMYIVMHFIWNQIRKELKRRLMVIDEAWWMMKSEDTASFLYGLAKRGRKYYLGLATITQDVEDFLKSPYGLPIITNSSIQLLLKQSPSSIDIVAKTFNLTDEEKYLLLESDVGEGIFFAGLKHVAIKVISSYTEDQIITSSPSQVLNMKKAKADLAAKGLVPESQTASNINASNTFMDNMEAEGKRNVADIKAAEELQTPIASNPIQNFDTSPQPTVPNSQYHEQIEPATPIQ